MTAASVPASRPLGPPLLSVVVPVHRVERYLPACLESILAEAGEDVEVVAVDDHSPDSSGAILDRYAAADPRVRVVHLATNVGLGRARNAGLDRARGGYVWFVDSDDWLPPGAVPAVTARLAATGPDVLLVDHIEVGADGEPGADGESGADHGSGEEHRPGAAGSGGSGPVRLAERPELLRRPLATSACTKVVRRELLAAHDLRFPPGWYEDCAYTYPLLLAAERIETLDRVGYCYRKCREGAITGSRSGRHFDVFEQYERMWAWLDGQGGPDGREGRDRGGGALRPELFRLMVEHLLVIAGNPHRLPAGRRREFFGRVAQEYRRRLPDRGYPVPAGVAGLKHRLIRADSYRGYAALRLAWRLATGVAGPGRRLARPAPGGDATAPAAVPAPDPVNPTKT